MHFDWPNPGTAGFKSHAAACRKTKPRDLESSERSTRTQKQEIYNSTGIQDTHQGKMKAVIVFVLLFAAVYCHPVKRSASSSESSEVQPVDTQALKVTPVTDISSEETTLIPVIDGRGDSIGYQSDYNKPIYDVDGNNIEKGPSPYKSYESDKTEYNDVKVYKALQVHNVGLDQGMDTSSGTDADDVSQQEPKAASTSSASDATPSVESDEDSQSSEEDTTAPTMTDSNSSESDESDEINTTDQTALIKSDNAEVVIA
ncbi:spp1 protein precursor [Silurus asotus]|uniref:Spp1 protein n=1 Tax=Silurus asotus TaxID=30991 RepID=A0AAD5ADY9_SILAS|nr:spp1 protein precursor [Silurus asotus]